MILPILNAIFEQFFPKKGKICKISKRFNRVLIDSGASHNFVSKENCKGFQLAPIRPLTVANAVQDFSGAITEVLEVNVHIENTTFSSRRFYVLETMADYDAIIGMSILKSTVLNLSGRGKFIEKVVNNKLKIVKPSHFWVEKSMEKSGIFCCETVILSPYEKKGVNIYTKPKIKLDDGIILKPDEKICSAGISLDPMGTVSSQIKIYNNSGSVISIDKGSKIGSQSQNEFHRYFNSTNFDLTLNYLISKDDLSAADRKIHEKEVEEWEIRRQELIAKYSLSEERSETLKNIPLDFREKMEKLFIEYNEIWSRGKNDVGLAPHWVVDLVFKEGDSGQPSYSRPYKIKSELKEKLDSKIEEMLNAGILEICSSPWSTPTMVVPKKNSDIRIVHNFSKNINDRLIVSHFPIVGNREIFSDISKGIEDLKKNFPGETIFFHSLDLSNAYFTLGVKASKRDILSFVVNDKQVRYRRLAQGLSLSPSVFQLYMKKLIYGGNFDKNFCKVYNFLDDWILLLPQSHVIEGLELFFRQCRTEKFILNLRKCKFFETKLKFLGFLLSQNGIENEESRINALLELEDPVSTRQGQRIMGSLNFIGRSYPRIQQYLAPLAKMIGKEKFVLTNEIKLGLQKIKGFMRSHPKLLPHLRYNVTGIEKIFVCVDSSLSGCGFCCGNCKYENSEIFDIEISHYGSRAFDAQIQLLSSRARELIGASFALLSFSDIIPENLEFLLIVDHKSLTHIKNSEQLNKTLETSRARLAFSRILNYPYMKIIYLSNQHELICISDGLSRNEKFKVSLIPEQWLNSFSFSSNLLNVYQEKVSREKIEEYQKIDKFLVDIKLKLNKDGEYESKLGRFKVKNGLIYVVVKSGIELIYIPAALSIDIINMIHIQSVHPGAKLLQKIISSSNFYIKNRFELVRRVTRNCLFCQLRRPNQYPKQENIYYPIRPALRPMAAVALDLVDVSYRENQKTYGLLLVDKFSHYLDFELIQDKSSNYMIPAIMVLATRNGCCHYSICQSDNGREFVNKNFAAALERLGIGHHRSSPYNSSTNPVERVIREIRSLMDVLEPSANNFRFKFALAVNTYNSRPQTRLNNLSPIEILRGADRPVVLGHLEDSPIYLETENVSDNSVLQWFEFMKKLQINHARNEVERYNSALHENRNFEIGQFVTLMNPVISLSKISGRSAEGPYLIISKSKNTYELQHIIERNILRRNGRFIRALHLENWVEKELWDFHKNRPDGSKITLPPPVAGVGYKLDLDGLQDSEFKTRKYNLRKRD